MGNLEWINFLTSAMRDIIRAMHPRGLCAICLVQSSKLDPLWWVAAYVLNQMATSESAIFEICEPKGKDPETEACRAAGLASEIFLKSMVGAAI